MVTDCVKCGYDLGKETCKGGYETCNTCKGGYVTDTSTCDPCYNRNDTCKGGWNF